MKLFQLVQTFGSLMVLGVMILVWGVPAAPAVVFFSWANATFSSTHVWIDGLYTGLALSCAGVIYMLAMLAFSCSLQFLLRKFQK